MLADARTRKLIYDSTSGYCHLCFKKLSFKNYGKHGERGSWHIDHSNPRFLGGTDRLSNLKPACIKCNCSKQAGKNKLIRSVNGFTKAPHSRKKQKRIKKENAFTGAALGAAAGAILGGPVGALIGSGVGALFGRSQETQKNPRTSRKKGENEWL